MRCLSKERASFQIDLKNPSLTEKCVTKRNFIEDGSDEAHVNYLAYCEIKTSELRC